MISLLVKSYLIRTDNFLLYERKTKYSIIIRLIKIDKLSINFYQILH
jgi:hypothetical protein